LGRKITLFATLGDFIDYYNIHRERRILSFELLKNIMGQLFLGLAVYHRAHVAHRDLKTGNILLFPGPNNIPLLKIADLDTLTEVDPRTGRFSQQYIMQVGIQRR
jgi:serine/threonine protein kinase